MFIEEFDNIDEQIMEALEKVTEVWAPGIKIISIRVTKPRIPKKLKYLFERMESERANLLIEDEKKKACSHCGAE